jgi:hypothetical protein
LVRIAVSIRRLAEAPIPLLKTIAIAVKQSWHAGGRE